MNTSLSNYPINPSINYWIANPQVRYIKPFDDIYKIDDGGELSSKYMYIITFMCDPDEQENKYFRMSEEVRRINLESFYKGVNWDLSEFKAGLDAYPYECLDSIQRALKEELESIKVRAQLISETPYTLDDYLRDEEGVMILDKTGKPISMKGTWKQLDDMRKATVKIYDDLDLTIAKYASKRSDDIRVRGGRKETPHERGLI